MKTHTNAFKDNIKLFGRELDSIVTYELNNQSITLGNDDINSVSPHYEGSILKSVMKQLDIDSNTEIPVGTILNYQFGIKVRNNDVEDYRDNYDYINFGSYIVKEIEKQEDTNSWKITCYDKMLYSMKDYETPKVGGVQITYPITIRNYINAICSYLGLTFKNINNSFANYNKQIQNELYLDAQGNSLGYTFRDVLDELAQATGSTICINEEDNELEIRYITETSDTIDEDFLKDINVNFGEVYGAVNTIILSRSGGSDKVYKSYPDDLPENQRIAIEIADNQIMNWNDRADYLPDILNKLNGLSYSLTDFSSTGIAYYNLCDRYTVQIGEETYSCIMFNDEINITQGLEENIFSEIPNEADTDYSKADKTDRRINQTYLIVDKQNQTISSVVSTVEGQNQQISQITQTVDELNSKISDIANITVSAEDVDAQVELEDINEGEPIQINIHPIGGNISYLYPRNNLYPSSNLYMTTRTIRFTNTSTNETFDYVLPEDLLYYDADNYDEFIFDYGDGTPQTKICKVEKKCKYNADGTVGLLTTPETHNYISSYVPIDLTAGDYTVSILGYSQGYVFARLLASNIYTTQFATKTELRQTASEITTTAEETYTTKDETETLSSKISQTAKEISLSVNNGSTSSGIVITTTKEDGSTSQTTGTIQMNGLVSFTNLATSGQTQINGGNITTGTIDASQVNVTNIDADNITSGTISANKINGGTINASNINLKNVSLGTGTSTIGGFSIGSTELLRQGNNYAMAMTYVNNYYGDGNIPSFLVTRGSNPLYDPDYYAYMNYYGFFTNGEVNARNVYVDGDNITTINSLTSGRANIKVGNAIRLNAGNNGNNIIYAKGNGLGEAQILTTAGQSSSLNIKENVKKFDNNEYDKALDLLDKMDLYSYKYKYNKKENSYGFIIDYLEEMDKNDFFKFYKERAFIKGDELNCIDDEYKLGEDEKEIFIKRYDSDVLDKYLLTICKAMYNEIKELKERISRLEKESDK